jgi:heme exporter protein A
MLAAVDVSCVRGERTLFSRVSFDLAPGESLQVIGANGSGKSSLLRIIATLLPPSAGEVTWKGNDVRGLREDYRRELVYIGHSNSLKDELSVHENLRSFALLLNGGTAGVEMALSRLGLERARNLPVRSLSQGQKRRVAMARLALLPQPPLWLLDEPLSALDSESCSVVTALVKSHLDSGGIAITATHQELGWRTTRTLALGNGAVG